MQQAIHKVYKQVTAIQKVSAVMKGTCKLNTEDKTLKKAKQARDQVIQQFNFARQWTKKIAPLLADRDVIDALNFGMTLYDDNYREGHPPYNIGSIPSWGRRPRKGRLSWYQPWNRCHFIAPFCWALGMKLYPDRKWGFISGEKHSVAIGWWNQWKQPDILMDILLFREYTAQQSLDFAKSGNWKFYPDLSRYGASFFPQPRKAYAILSGKIGPLTSDHRRSRWWRAGQILKLPAP